MNFLDKIKIISSNIYSSTEFKRHDEFYFCNKFICEKGIYEMKKISEITPSATPTNKNIYYNDLEYMILEFGVDKMDPIIVNNDNVILDGNIRYDIYKTHFGDNLSIKLLKFTEIKEGFLNEFFYICYYLTIKTICWFFSLFKKKNNNIYLGNDLKIN